MKIKNVSYLDRNAHKFAPLAALLFLLGVLWFYVLGEPYQVAPKNGGMSAPPEQVESDILQASTHLERAINKSESPLKAPMNLIPYTEDFHTRALRSLVGKTDFDVPLGPPGLDSKVFTPTPLPPSEYMVHLPPPAIDVKARPTYGVLSSHGNPAEMPEWIKLVGDHEPRDIRIVTVTGAFDVGEWRRRLASPPVGARIPVPESWWRSMLAVTDVTVQRQKLDPATGQWGSIETLPSLPNNRFGYLRKQGENFTGNDPTQIIHTVAVEQDPITHPPPPPLTSDHPWLPPGAEAPLSEEQLKQIADLTGEISLLQEQLEHLGGGAAAHPTTPTKGPVPAAGTGKGSAEHGASHDTEHRPAAPTPSHTATPTGGRTAAAEAADREKLAAQIKEKKAERDALRLGKTYNKDQPVTGGGHRRHAPPVSSDPDKVLVWAHDVTAQPGQTYRYRLLISVLDPLFQRPNLNPEQRSDYFQTLALTSDPDHDESASFRGAWSEPVEIDRDTYFFLTNANPGGRSVTVTVWRLYGGHWRSKEFNVQPGDLIGQVATPQGLSKPVDMSVNAVAVDIDPLSRTSRPLIPTTPKLIYLDNLTGKLLSRTLMEDREDPRYLRIKGEEQTTGPVVEKP